MLIYLDANIVQYCADYDDFIFGNAPLPPGIQARVRKELVALRELIEIELELEYWDFQNRWDIAAPSHLIKELFAGEPTKNQKSVYSLLMEAWNDLEQSERRESNEDETLSIEKLLRPLKLKHAADRRHLAEAIALRATWFLTNDRDIIEKTRPKPAQVGNKVIGIMPSTGIVHGVRVARPSECVVRMSLHPVWGLIQQE
ncbi:MAG: hypothetical protein ABIH46_01615 [Chloroflexota bacterium]